MLISYLKALEIIHQKITPLQITHKTTLLESLYRISSHDILAKWDMPNESISLKEGYGIHLGTATSYHLMSDKKPSFIPVNHAIELSTGDFITQGINAVVAKEESTINTDGTLSIPDCIHSGYNIKQKGEDFVRGQCILKRFEPINAFTLAAIASQGFTHIETFRPPKVAILSIGNALISLGTPKQSSMIYNSNAISLAARITELGAFIHGIDVCSEEPLLIMEKLALLAQEADFIITTGGMGTHDAMHETLSHKDLSVLFHYVQISPARPSALSLFKHKPILHLPGLPLSCLLGFEMLGSIILKALQHQAINPKQPITLINQQIFTCKACSTSAIPGFRDGETFTCASAYQAAMLTTLSMCNGYILTEGKERLDKGAPVLFYPF